MLKSFWEVIIETKKYWDDFIQTDVWPNGQLLGKYRVSGYPESVRRTVEHLLRRCWKIIPEIQTTVSEITE